MKYAFYSDLDHGWLKVSIEEINQLAITHDISASSFISACGKYAFLDKNTDAKIFVQAILDADWFEDFEAVRKCTKEFYSNFPSFILNLESFSTCKEKKLSQVISKSFEL
jgi:hypothetical protein